MPLVPIELPPGMYKNGTEYSGKNRYVDGSRVRWHDGALRPIGGWERAENDLGEQIDPITADPDETVRDGYTWRTNSGNKVNAWGSNKHLYFHDEAGVVTDVTPAGFTGGGDEPTTSRGYGTGAYGRQTYGTPRKKATLAPDPVYRWSFSNWGEDLIGCAAFGFNGPIYSYTPGEVIAETIPGAPTDVLGCVVTDQRILMAIGSNTDSRTVRWSDRENREDWVPTKTNYADTRTLQGSGNLMSIDLVLNTILILSETDAHAGRWVGAPYVYGFERIGNNCGPVHPGAVLVTDRFAIWLGRRTFWMFDGTIKPVPCTVMDFLQRDINFDMISKMHSVNVPAYNECWWFYQSVDSGSDDVDSYVMYDYLENQWCIGKLKRTAAVPGDTFELPMMIDHGQRIWWHELSGVVPEDTWAMTGPLEFGQGDKNLAVRYVFPDTRVYGDVTYTFFTRQMPTAADTKYGPFAYANPMSPHVMGREVRMRIDGQITRWEVGGKTRFDVAPIGTGMR